MYDLLRSLMFRLPAETSHDLALDMIGAAGRLRLADKLVRPVPSQPVQVMGLTFDNPVGLAAGLDKNAVAVDGLAAMGAEPCLVFDDFTQRIPFALHGPDSHDGFRGSG